MYPLTCLVRSRSRHLHPSKCRFCASESLYIQVANFQPIDWSLFCVFSLLLVSLLWNVLLFCGPAMLHLSNTSASVRWGQKVAKEMGNMEKEKGSFPHVPLSACNSGLPRELWHINNEVPLLLRRRTIYRFFQHLQAICLWSWIWMCIFQDIAALWYCFCCFLFLQVLIFWCSLEQGLHFRSRWVDVSQGDERTHRQRRFHLRWSNVSRWWRTRGVLASGVSTYHSSRFKSQLLRTTWTHNHCRPRPSVSLPSAVDCENRGRLVRQPFAVIYVISWVQLMYRLHCYMGTAYVYAYVYASKKLDMK